MSLRDQFIRDLDRVFYNVTEHATIREFRISNGQGGFIIFSAPCIWDGEAAKSAGITKAQGVFLGDVICHIGINHFPRMPLTGELLYSPANNPWEVLICTEEEGAYVIGLSASRSQPAYYGNN